MLRSATVARARPRLPSIATPVWLILGATGWVGVAALGIALAVVAGAATFPLARRAEG